MPNNTSNYVNVIGKLNRLEEFKSYVKPDEIDGEDVVPFSLNKIIPMPVELRDTKSPTTLVTVKEYNKYHTKRETAKRLAEWQKLREEGRYIHDDKPMTRKMSKEMIKRLGYDNWYDWSNANWYTKWDAYEHDFWQGYDDKEVITNPGATGEIEYFFYTAWSPPEPIYNILSDVFGDLEIDWSYIDEGGGFCGTFGTREYVGQDHGDNCECYGTENEDPDTLVAEVSVADLLKISKGEQQ